jgi:hypothetical protein
MRSEVVERDTINTRLDLGELADGICRQIDTTLEAVEALRVAMRGGTVVVAPQSEPAPDDTPATWMDVIRASLASGPRPIAEIYGQLQAEGYEGTVAQVRSLLYGSLASWGSGIVHVSYGVYGLRKEDV